MKVLGCSIRRKTVTKCKRTFVGCWLAFLYVICVSSVIYSLSSYQIQSKLNSIPKNSAENSGLFVDHTCDVSKFNKNDISTSINREIKATLPCIPTPSASPVKKNYYSFGKVLLARDKSKLINTNINEARNLKQELLEKLENLQNEPARSDNGILQAIIERGKEKQAQSDEEILQAVVKVSKEGQAISNLINNTIESTLQNEFHIGISEANTHEHTLNSAINSEIDVLKIANEANNVKVQSDLYYLKKAAEANKQTTTINQRYLKSADEANKQTTEINQRYLKSAIKDNRDSIDKKLEQLLAKKTAFISEHHEFADVLSNIEYFESFFGWISKILGTPPFWALPESILIQILVLSTGVLGSIIFVTVEFLKEPEDHIQSLSMYLFRPFLGMILALAIYVMLKSGQFTFIKDNNQNLSPFLISFLGIISGMLAEQAYRRIAMTGSAVLNGKETAPKTRGPVRSGRRAEDTKLGSYKRA